MATGPLMPRPATLRKPFDEMTVAELQAEQAFWQQIGDPSTVMGAAARMAALTCAALITRRRQVEPPNGVVIPMSVPFASVPLIGGDPIDSGDQVE